MTRVAGAEASAGRVRSVVDDDACSTTEQLGSMRNAVATGARGSPFAISFKQVARGPPAAVESYGGTTTKGAPGVGAADIRRRSILHQDFTDPPSAAARAVRVQGLAVCLTHQRPRPMQLIGPPATRCEGPTTGVGQRRHGVDVSPLDALFQPATVPPSSRSWVPARGGSGMRRGLGQMAPRADRGTALRQYDGAPSDAGVLALHVGHLTTLRSTIAAVRLEHTELDGGVEAAWGATLSAVPTIKRTGTRRTLSAIKPAFSSPQKPCTCSI